MRYLDAIVGSQLEALERLEFEFKESLDSETGAFTMKSVDIKNKIDAIRISLIEDLKEEYRKAIHLNKVA